jgi:hypothetical protein
MEPQYINIIKSDIDNLLFTFQELNNNRSIYNEVNQQIDIINNNINKDDTKKDILNKKNRLLQLKSDTQYNINILTTLYNNIKHQINKKIDLLINPN